MLGLKLILVSKRWGCCVICSYNNCLVTWCSIDCLTRNNGFLSGTETDPLELHAYVNTGLCKSKLMVSHFIWCTVIVVVIEWDYYLFQLKRNMCIEFILKQCAITIKFNMCLFMSIGQCLNHSLNHYFSIYVGYHHYSSTNTIFSVSLQRPSFHVWVSPDENKTTMRPFYLYHGTFVTDKTISLFCNSQQKPSTKRVRSNIPFSTLARIDIKRLVLRPK